MRKQVKICFHDGAKNTGSRLSLNTLFLLRPIVLCYWRPAVMHEVCVSLNSCAEIFATCSNLFYVSLSESSGRNTFYASGNGQERNLAVVIFLFSMVEILAGWMGKWRFWCGKHCTLFWLVSPKIPVWQLQVIMFLMKLCTKGKKVFVMDVAMTEVILKSKEYSLWLYEKVSCICKKLLPN